MQKLKEIAVISGKGGTGKTSLVAAFATMANHPVVADCDVDAANLYLILHPENYKEGKFVSGHKAIIDYNACTHCGLCMAHCRFDAIERKVQEGFPKGKITIDDINCDGCWLCSRICPEKAITMVPEDDSRWYIGNYRNGKMVHARLSPGEENSGKLVSKVRELAKETAEAEKIDLILIDGPPGTGCSAIASLTGADKVLAVTEPTGSGLHDLKRIMELAGKFQIERCVVINKYDLNRRMTEEIKQWCSKENISVIGTIPFEPDMVHSMVHCKSITEWTPDSPISAVVKEIFERLII
ncbi:MAG: P-loop NTPase [Bacteroidales bacterium]|nr:P-loop NTPase [Bacteroidales bacterium]